MQVDEASWTTRFGDHAEAWRSNAALVKHELVVSAREAFAAMSPGDIEAVSSLVEAVLDATSSEASAVRATAVAHDFLDELRRRRFTSAMTADLADRWADLAVRVVERTNFTVPQLLLSRERTDPEQIAMRVLGDAACDITVAELARRTRSIARGLLGLLGDQPDGFVALLADNSLESALCDIACLSNGIVNIRVPANATAAQVEYIVGHSEAHILVVSDEAQLMKVLPSLPSLPLLRSVVVFSRGAAERHGLLSFDQLVAQAGGVDDAVLERRAAAVRSGDLASIMYTSGTTGLPKGITFSHLNVVSKRFCRAFALPELGEGDIFLSYLPMFHTFGRWLEMMGTLFWGATYVFARNPSQASLLEDFASVRPTVFISVPKKWSELYEQAVREAGCEDADLVTARLRALTGGHMRGGLSAAGYLDPVVFRAMNRAGIDLCSGYGMTEATGGITMTPPRDYRDGSIGKALPGIELRIAEDGELLIRGPYVMLGYFHSEDGASGLDEEGWFPSGDIVSVDDDGHYRLVDRKKEIYKNRKGQTIVPQRIENLYRDFDVVSQAFLVGDQLEYNTLLIWPNFEGHPELKDRSDAELRDLIGSLVVSANRFLARYERVVAFAFLPRALSEEQGELTPKGTYKRQVVRDRWKELFEPMYRDRFVSFDVDGTQLRIPDWVLRDMGVVKDNLALRDGVLYALDRPLALTRDAGCADTTRVGDFHYRTSASHLDLGALLSRPSVWLGNDQLVQFLGDEAFHALVSRRHEAAHRVELAVCEGATPADARVWDLATGLTASEATPSSVHAAAVLMRVPGPQAAAAVSHLERGASQRQSGIAGLCREVLRRAADTSDRAVVRLAFRALVSAESETELLGTVEHFLAASDASLLAEDDLVAIVERGLPDSHVQLLVDALSSHANLGNDAPRPTPAVRNTLGGMMRIVSAYAVTHPEWYARTRFPLARLALHADEAIAARAGEQLDRLQLGFRVRIGANVRLAVDPDNGEEYGWRDVLVFDDEVPEEQRKLITKAITETTLVRESVFLFGKGALLSLSELPRRSMWVSLLGSKHGKSVYRLSIQTRDRGAFDVAMNVAETIPVAELREEIGWLMAAGDEPPLSELFGGYFPEYGIFTEEFIPGETVERQVARLMRLGALDRLRALWPFLVWSGLGVHIDFWERSGRTVALRQPAPTNVIIPSHDYHVGARLISISDRSPCTSIDDLLHRFEEAFIRATEASTPELAKRVSPVILLSAFIETLGLERGLALLASAKEGAYGGAIMSFLEAVKARGYTPKRLYFASLRYARWIALNPAATVEARGDMLRELWETYGLDADEARYPDTRVRFFRQTVFKEARTEVVSELDRLMAAARVSRMTDDQMSEQVAAARGSMRPTEEEDYFLARMTYRHLRPTDDAAIISMPTGSTRVTDVAVTLHDHEGGRFRVRGPVSPRDVGRLLDLFHKTNLLVSFAPEHEFLLAIDDADLVIGGMFYRRVDDETVYLEKIVVSRRHRKKGISDGLMREFMRRELSRGGKFVETGFFRPEYLLRFGFRTDARSSGLVRDLAAQPIERASRSEER